MDQTSLSLLERLRARPEDASWRRLIDLYSPLIEGWLARAGVAACDADDISQDILETIVRELPQFVHPSRIIARPSTSAVA